jgi:hypothetical protein
MGRLPNHGQTFGSNDRRVRSSFERCPFTFDDVLSNRLVYAQFWSFLPPRKRVVLQALDDAQSMRNAQALKKSRTVKLQITSADHWAKEELVVPWSAFAEGKIWETLGQPYGEDLEQQTTGAAKVKMLLFSTGQQIGKEHKQYWLAYAMMLGMRVAAKVAAALYDERMGDVSVKTEERSHGIKQKLLLKYNCSVPGSRRVVPADADCVDGLETSTDTMLTNVRPGLVFRLLDYTAVHPFVLPHHSTPHHSQHPITFEDYAPLVFSELRHRVFGVSSADYLESLCRLDYHMIEFISNSKSGAFFFFSHDGKYLVKTLTAREMRKLMRMLPSYHQVRHLVLAHSACAID